MTGAAPAAVWYVSHDDITGPGPGYVLFGEVGGKGATSMKHFPSFIRFRLWGSDGGDGMMGVWQDGGWRVMGLVCAFTMWDRSKMSDDAGTH